MMKKLLFIIPILFLVTGCYNYRELNDLAIVSAISIGMDNDEFSVTIQVVNPKKEQDTSSSNEPDFITYKNNGKSLQEVFRYIVKESPKKIYAAQMQILIIDEDVAKEKLEDILDFIARDPEIRNEFAVLISKDKDLLDVLTPLDNISSQNILDSLKSDNNYLGINNIVTFNDLLSNYENNKIDLALPSIELKGDLNKGSNEESLESSSSDCSIVLSTMGVFKDNKLQGYLTDKESIGYNLIMDNVTNTLIKNEYKDGKYIVNELVKVNSSLEANPKKNKIKISLKGNAAISEVNYNIDLSEEKNIKKVEKKLNNEIESLIKTTINNIREKYDSDIFGFEDLYYKTDPEYYKLIKDKWDTDIYKSIDIEVDSNVEIVEQGNILGRLKNE